MSDKPGLKLVAHTHEFFHSLVTEAIGRQKVTTQPEAEFYLVNLLSQFMTTDRLYAQNEKGIACEEPLALMVKGALEQPEPEAQRALFRRIGDVSLYTAGFFQDSLNRKLVDVDYYINMGGTAYEQVAARAEENVMKLLYQELAEKFSSFVEVLAEVSDKTAQRSEKDILRLYDLWLRTRSERAAKALQEAGIVPNSTVKKDWQ